MPFEPFEKIARLSRNMIITEKLDGTNAQIFIRASDSDDDPTIETINGFAISAGSRSQWLLPTKGRDNFGFAAWVAENAEALVTLGEGRHFGEWWGSGIQRGYGLSEKRFSLFNVNRWSDECPLCCHVVPTLCIGDFDTQTIFSVMDQLKDQGSYAAPGFMKPEGVVIFHTQGRMLFKKTFEKDTAGKEHGA